MSAGLTVEQRDRVVIATLDRPEQRNAVTMALQAELDAALTEWEADPEVGCVVLTGAGDAFSAGYDLREMAPWDADELLDSLVQREAWIEHLATTPVPIVAAINGLAIGVGAIFASAVDVRVAAEDAYLQFTAGKYDGANATWSLPGIVGRGPAAEILMTARRVPADEALRLGLVSRVVPRADVLEAAVETAAAIAANPPRGVRAIKRLLRDGSGRTSVEALAAENELMRTELRPQPIKQVYANAGESAKRAVGS